MIWHAQQGPLANGAGWYQNVGRNIPFRQQLLDERLAEIENRVQNAVMRGAFLGGALGALLSPAGAVEIWCGAGIGSLFGGMLAGAKEIIKCYLEETTPTVLFYEIYPPPNE